ncbi:MAG: PSD1 domain-containing protein [Phycisphaeraceae bacterium]|nr:PSD1 domain-containing protein [Phycisphaeraceae bacterium]
MRAILLAAAMGAMGLAALRPGLRPSPARVLDDGPLAAPSFNRDVRPILAENCFKCHGPDVHAREANLRLDTREGALTPAESGRPALIPGNASESRLLARIADSGDSRMPPPHTDKVLSETQILTLRRWIDAGALYERHWSLISPVRPAPPEVLAERRIRTAIDRFLLSRLESQGLEFAPEAPRHTLIRRLALDLTGIPPTPEEVDAFVHDPDPLAYEHLVGRLLDSPRYGERMAMDWLDAARFADTNGYHIDNERAMWRWRDWAISAFNDNMPFDEFTIEQLAGDLLPDATLRQRIATGFCRNHMINFEGGAIPEEYLNEYRIDRVNTLSTVWLGMTLACAQCHDHKYDPVTQEEYYRLYAFFTGVPEIGLDGRAGNSAPTIAAPTPDQAVALEAVRDQLAAAEAALREPIPELDARQREWESDLSSRLAGLWRTIVPDSLSAEASTLTSLSDGVIVRSGELADTDVYEIVATVDRAPITALRLEILADPSLPQGGPGTYDNNGNFVLSTLEVHAAPASAPDHSHRIRLVGAQADFNQPQFNIRGAIDDDPQTGWAIQGGQNADHVALLVPNHAFGYDGGTLLTIRLRFESRFPRHMIGRLRLSAKSDPDGFDEISPSALSPWVVAGPFQADTGPAALQTEFVPEGTFELNARTDEDEPVWQPHPELVDGVVHSLPGERVATYLARTITSPGPRDVTLSLGSDDAIKVWLNGALIHDNPVARAAAPDQDAVVAHLNRGENTLVLKVADFGGAHAVYFELRDDYTIDPPVAIERLLAIAEPRRTADQRDALAAYYRSLHWDRWGPLSDRATALRTDESTLVAEIPTVMVMQSGDMPLQASLLERGLYDRPVRTVTAGVPAAFPPLPADRPADRLALAQWLVSPDHPLTSRVYANRLWQMLFGVGLVSTSEDFGVQGEWPSNPELLDWLAVEFMESGWDIKHMLRLIVCSEAYRQIAGASPLATEMDPTGRMLSHYPRRRLSAEGMRDNALAISGLLVERIGGPSIRPYQPPGLWEELAIDPDGSEFTAQVYVQDHGESLYRRGMYIFRKRTVPPPNLQIMDAPNREVCTVRRATTNTPLQALVLWNDPVFVEASRAFAQRVLLEDLPDAESRLRRAWRFALGREPSPDESEIFGSLLREQRDAFSRDTTAAEELLKVGESPRDKSLELVEHAAWTVVCNAILSLDETISIP